MDHVDTINRECAIALETYTDAVLHGTPNAWRAARVELDRAEMARAAAVATDTAEMNRWLGRVSP